MIWIELLKVPVIIVLLTIIVTKLLDLLTSLLNEKREFKKYIRNKSYNEIEELKEELGKLVELASNWKGYDQKEAEYRKNFVNDHELIGRFNKYPPIANYARDTIHWCAIVASCEKKVSDDLIENKKELKEKYKLFLQECDKYINSLA